jgi:hypothetical protein
MFFLILPFLAQSQSDSVNINGEKYCLRYLSDIIKEEKKARYWRMPEEFTGYSTDFKKDSSYVFIKKRKYLQVIYFSDKFKLKTLRPINNMQKKIYIQDVINNRKGKIEFTEICDLTFKGARKKNKLTTFYFQLKFDGYGQDFSLKFGEDSMLFNFDFPALKKCD